MKLLIIMILVFSFSRNIRACDKELQVFKDDCEIQDAYQKLKNDFIEFNIDIEQIAFYRILRFIHENDYQKKYLQNQIAPWDIYDPAPNTWNLWEKGLSQLESLLKHDQGEGQELEAWKKNSLFFNNWKMKKLHKAMIDESQIHYISKYLKGASPAKIREGNFNVAPSFNVFCEGNDKIDHKIKNLLDHYDLKTNDGTLYLNALLTPCAPPHQEYFQGMVFYLPSKYVHEELEVLWQNVDFYKQQYQKSSLSLSPIQFAAKLQRQLVAIHPFGEGNGRISRIMQDYFLKSMKLPYLAAGQLSNDIFTSPEEYQKLTLNNIKEQIKHLQICYLQYKNLFNHKGQGISRDCENLKKLEYNYLLQHDHSFQKTKSFFLDLISFSDKRYSRKNQLVKIKELINTHAELIVWILKVKKIESLVKIAQLPQEIIKPLEKNPFASVQSLLPSQDILDLVNPLSWSSFEKYIDVLAENLNDIVKRTEFLDSIPDTAFLEIADFVNDKLANFKFSDTDMLKLMMDNFNFENIAADQSKVIAKIMINYFDNLTYPLKKRIILALLNIPPKSPPTDQLMVILQNAGPAFQKLFQLFGEEFKSEKIRIMMRQLKANIRANSIDEVRAILMKNYPPEQLAKISKIDEIPMASGTVGQVHRVEITTQTQGSENKSVEAIMKVQHMYSQIEARDELYALRKIQLPPWAQRTLSQLEEILKTELDFRVEGHNLELAKVYIHPEIGIDAVTSPEGLPSSEMVLFMKRAKGKMINNFKEEDLAASQIRKEQFLLIKGDALINLFNLWFQEAIFGSGFFHADVHAGNIFLELLDPMQNPSYHLTLIDFGSVGQLNKKEQKGILLTSLGIKAKIPDLFLKGMDSLIQIDDSQKKKKFFQLTSKIINSDKFFSDKVNEIIILTNSMNINLPNSFIQFNRGRKFLIDQINAVNAELDKIDPYSTSPRVDLTNLFNESLKSKIMDNVRDVLFTSQKDKQLVFNIYDFLKIAYHLTRDTTIQCLKGDFSIPCAALEMGQNTIIQQIEENLYL